MIDIPLSLAFNLAKGTVRLGWRAKKLRDEARETGKLVQESVECAVAQLDLDPGAAEKLAEAIVDELARTPLLAMDRPTGIRRLVPKPLRRGIPDAGVLTGAPFSERMEWWLIKCMEGERVERVLARLKPGSAFDPQQVAEGFSVAFHGLLVQNPSTFNEELIKELQSSEAAREWMEEKRKRFEGGAVGMATAGAGAYGVAQLANVHDPLAIAAAVAGAAGVSGLAWLGSLSRPHASLLQRTARRIALGWVVDLLGSLGTAPSVESVAELRLIIARSEQWEYGRSPLVDPELLNDLNERVVGVATEAEDERLVAAIREVEDAAVRAARKGPSTLAEALTGMLDAIAADGAIREAEAPAADPGLT